MPDADFQLHHTLELTKKQKEMAKLCSSLPLKGFSALRSSCFLVHLSLPQKWETARPVVLSPGLCITCICAGQSRIAYSHLVILKMMIHITILPMQAEVAVSSNVLLMLHQCCIACQSDINSRVLAQLLVCHTADCAGNTGPLSKHHT